MGSNSSTRLLKGCAYVPVRSLRAKNGFMIKTDNPFGKETIVIFMQSNHIHVFLYTHPVSTYFF